MKVRVIALSLMLTLSGCSSLDHWFGDKTPAPMPDNQIGAISINTPFSEDGLTQALGSDYHLRGGMGMKNNELFSFFQALKEIDGKEQIAQIIYGKYDTGIVRVEVFEPGISTGEASVGTPFSEIYTQAFGACGLEQDDSHRSVICLSPKHANVSYVFGGDWNGPEGLIPDNDALMTWTVNKIVWHTPNQRDEVVSAAVNSESEDQIGALVQSIEQKSSSAE
jgi:hypothetical protein